MKRIQLFEFEDFSWFPDWMRSCMTGTLLILQKMMKTDKVIASVLNKVQKETNLDTFVDLGSGEGNVVLNAIKLYPQLQMGIGIELSKSRHERAIEKLENSNKPKRENV